MMNLPTNKKRRRDPEKRRLELLEAARHEFAVHGLSGARVDNIVNRAGVNKQLMYYYFGDKEALYGKVLEQAYIDIRSGESRMNLTEVPPVEAMERFIRYTFKFVRENRYFVALLNDANLHQAKHLENSTVIKERHDVLRQIIGDIMERGYSEDVFKRRVDPVDLYITISSLSYFYFSNIYTMSKVLGRDLNLSSEIEHRSDEIVATVLSSLTTV